MDDMVLVRYPIDLTTISDLDLRQAFAQFLRDNTPIKAIMVGVRRSDPDCSQLHIMDPTDNGWPKFIRVHPILEWSHADVWSYLSSNSVPYCSLYDHGYTSLGDRCHTARNPNLRTADGHYSPAYLLEREGDERAGRL